MTTESPASLQKLKDFVTITICLVLVLAFAAITTAVTWRLVDIIKGF